MCSKYSVRPTLAKIYLQSDGLEKNKVLTGDVESTSVEDGGENVCGLWSLGGWRMNWNISWENWKERKTKIQGWRRRRKMFVICEIKLEDGGWTRIFPEKTGNGEKPRSRVEDGEEKCLWLVQRATVTLVREDLDTWQGRWYKNVMDSNKQKWFYLQYKNNEKNGK